MEKNDNEIFEFGNSDITEQQDSFKYDDINGLGESNYENEDLFNSEIDYTQGMDDIGNNFNVEDISVKDETDEQVDYSDNYLESVVPTLPDMEEEKVEEQKQEEPKEENKEEDNSKKDMVISETPIEELNKLTEYDEEKIESTDISDLFNKVSLNVKDASEVFKRNTDLKNKIDLRFEKLKKLQSEIESSKKSQLDEVDKYKEEVLGKLTEKKGEIEKRLNVLKEYQSNLEKERQDFEQYKKQEKEKIDKIQKQVQSAYDERREELSHIEDVLRKQKDALDEARNQLSLDKIQYEADKNELANNLLKFNDLVNSFTNGVKDVKE